MFRLRNPMPFVGIDHKLVFHAQSFQSMPELIRLRHGALPIPIAHQNERRSLNILDKSNRGAPGVNGWIVIDGRTEIRQQPLVDVVFPKITLPVGDTGAGGSRTETRGLSDG